MIKKEKFTYNIKTVCHALDLLEQFAGDTAELGITDLSRRLKLHKNKIFRLLATLESRKYIDQNEGTGRYRLGHKTITLGHVFANQMELLTQSKQIAAYLVRECNETVCVAVLKGFHVIYLDVTECNRTVKVVCSPGTILPAHCTAAGKVQLAYIGEDELSKHVTAMGLRQYTQNTIVDIGQFEKHLRQVARQGYATDQEELELGVRSVGAPIRDSSRRIVGAISISGPSFRFTEERINDEFIPLATEGARKISARL